MPIVGCYDLHLYCDNPKCEHGEYGDRSQAEFTGDDTGAAARSRARRAGWWLGRGGAGAVVCACPPCARSGARPTEPYDPPIPTFE